MLTAPVQHAITREIWGDGDALLLVFAGAAAEFAVSRAVDWLFVTGALPRDPLGRLFRTVGYAQEIAFADPATAQATLARIRRVHAAVEQVRGAAIPPWAHRAVLYMLIGYSERAAHLLGGPLDRVAREELYADFRRIGDGLGISRLPPDYGTWRRDRAHRLARDLAWSAWTEALCTAYRQQLGPWRYVLLRRLQGVLVPPLVRGLLRLPGPAWGSCLMWGIRVLRSLRLCPVARRLVVPPRHWEELGMLEQPAKRGAGNR